MNAIGSLRKFAHGHEMAGAPLVLLMPTDDSLPPNFASETATQDEGASDAILLRTVWDAERLRHGRAKVSQKVMALEWGVNASNITQYLNGHIPLNIGAKLRFAKFLGKPVREIWPDFEFASVAPGELPPDAIMIAAMWAGLPSPSQKIVSDLIRNLAGLPIAR